MTRADQFERLRTKTFVSFDAFLNLVFRVDDLARLSRNNGKPFIEFSDGSVCLISRDENELSH